MFKARVPFDPDQGHALQIMKSPWPNDDDQLRARMEQIMRHSLLLGGVLALALAASVGVSDSASAATKKKLTYEQAWAHCKALLDKEGA